MRYQVYRPAQVDAACRHCISAGADRDKLDPILDACVAVYKEQLDEDGQVDFKGKAKAFVRTYGFLAIDPALHQRRVGEALDLPELPDPEAAGATEEDLSKGILEAIDMDSYRVEKQAAQQISSPTRTRDRPGADRGWRRPGPKPELDRLSNILKSFNDQWGNIAWTDGDRVRRLISQDIPAKVAADAAYQNARRFGQAERPDRARQGACGG